MCIRDSSILLQSHEEYYSSGATIEGVFIPPPKKVRLAPNATIVTDMCQCGKIIYIVKAIDSTDSNQEISVLARTIAPRPGRHIVAQFDGSCHNAGSDFAASGCGVAIFLLTNDKVTLISEHSIPLLLIKTSPASEAEGAHHTLFISPASLPRELNLTLLRCREIT